MSGRQAVWAVIVALFVSFAVAGPAIMVRDAAQAGAGGEAVAPEEGDEPLVVMADLQFRPSALRVPAGTAVVWSNQDVTPHTVTTTTADSGLIDPAGSFTMTVTAPVTYICTLHAAMTGTIAVT